MKAAARIPIPKPQTVAILPKPRQLAVVGLQSKSQPVKAAARMPIPKPQTVAILPKPKPPQSIIARISNQVFQLLASEPVESQPIVSLPPPKLPVAKRKPNVVPPPKRQAVKRKPNVVPPPKRPAVKRRRYANWRPRKDRKSRPNSDKVVIPPGTPIVKNHVKGTKYAPGTFVEMSNGSIAQIGITGRWVIVRGIHDSDQMDGVRKLRFADITKDQAQTSFDKFYRRKYANPVRTQKKQVDLCTLDKPLKSTSAYGRAPHRWDYPGVDDGTSSICNK